MQNSRPYAVNEPSLIKNSGTGYANRDQNRHSNLYLVRAVIEFQFATAARAERFKERYLTGDYSKD